MQQRQKALSISQITQQIRALLEENLGTVQVAGEISNYKLHSSGHRYFSLKDENAQIQAVMWRARQPGFALRDGMKVLATGNITVYPPQGRYQLDCLTLLPLGTGDLYMAFEELKRQLAAQGLFDAGRKKSITALPLRIGIITSPTGAAVQDMLTTLKRRNPLCKVILRPTLVQGEAAIQDIAQAIHELQDYECDVIILARGGGSIEDLWAFNTETVALAIARSNVPIITGIGHETDYTIADFVADLRAPTPTAAAEIVTRISKADLLGFLENSQLTMQKAMQRHAQQQKDYLDQLVQHRSFRLLADTLHTGMQRTDELEMRLKQSIQRSLHTKKQSLQALQAHCTALYPLAPLRKGFALLEQNGSIIPAADPLPPGQEFILRRSYERTKISIIGPENP
jgi:exodeoxyribonuclease VII large subunit